MSFLELSCENPRVFKRMSMMVECPCCGACEVLGVWMPRVKARILRAAIRAGDHGVAPGAQYISGTFSASTFRTYCTCCTNPNPPCTDRCNSRMRSIQKSYDSEATDKGLESADKLPKRQALSRREIFPGSRVSAEGVP